GDVECIICGHGDSFGGSSWSGVTVRRTASLPLAYVPAIQVFLVEACVDVDARHKAGHDGGVCPTALARLGRPAYPFADRPRHHWPWPEAAASPESVRCSWRGPDQAVPGFPASCRHSCPGS